MKKGRFSNYEVEYIKKHYKTKTDSEIAKTLDRDPDAITRKRGTLGFKKPIGRPSGRSVEDLKMIKPESQLDREIYETLSGEQKRKLFRQKFKNTQRFKQIAAALSPEEIEFYSERFLDYMFAFETLLTHEEDTLHLAIMELIRSQRVLVRQREIRELIEEGEVVHGVGLEMLDRAYKENIQTYNDLMKNLNATRKQRIDKDKEEQFSLVTVVQQLQEEENRERAGKEAAMIKKAANYAKLDMRTKNYLLD